MRLNGSLTTAMVLFSAAILFGAASAFAAIAPQESPSSSSASQPLIEMHPSLKIRGVLGSGKETPVYAPDKTVNNRIVITGGSTKGLITGAYAPAASGVSQKPDILLQRNRVILLGGEISGSVHGAFGTPARAEGNTLLIDDQQALVRGDEADPSDVAATGAVGVESNRNTVLVHAGTILGNISGGEGNNLSSDNRVLLHGGFVSGSVYGGGSRDGRSGNNTVVMTGGTVQGQLIGGNSAGTGISGGNTVLFSGGITGGIMGSASQGGPANGNTIVISGGDVTPPLKRGKTGNASSARISGGESAGYGATGNRIFLGGVSTLRNCVFYGGYNTAGTSRNTNADYISGNTLSIEGDFQGQFPATRNFENIYLSGQGATLPAKGYSFHPSVHRFSNFGLLRFSSGRQPTVLRFSKTEYFAEEGAIALGSRMNGTDKVVIDTGALLRSPIRIHLENPGNLPVGIPIPIVEIGRASTMRGLSRRQAVVWASGGGNVIETATHVYQLKIALGGEDKDIWSVEKKVRPQN